MIQEPENKKSLKVHALKVHEWLAVLVMIGLIGMIVLVTFIESRKVKARPYVSFTSTHDTFDVMIKGAVNFPGIYHLSSPISLKEILEIASFKDDADLSRYALDGMIRKGRTLTVPSKAMITIYVEDGSGKKEMVKIKKGSKLSDLLNIVKFSEDADLSVFQKKRLLKNGETITVPQTF